MKKVIQVLLVVCFCFMSSFAENKVKDFEAKYGRLTINRATDKAFAAVKKVEDIKDKVLTIGNVATQKDFDKICTKLNWVKRLQLEHGNKQIANIKAIKNLTSLEELTLKGMKTAKKVPVDLAPLKTLTKLKKLDFYATPVTNTDALASLVNLKDVSFYMSDVDSINFLKSTPDIISLDLYGFGHSFKDYTPLINLKKLEVLNIYMNVQATDKNLEVLKALSGLKEIRMSNCKKVTSLDFLENCRNLKELHASWCRGLIDFSAISNMKKLERFKVSDSQLKSIDMVKGYSNLSVVDISGTKVKSIASLEYCPGLKDISCDETEISDISPLYKCKKIYDLSISSKVPQTQIKKIKSLIPDITVSVK